MLCVLNRSESVTNFLLASCCCYFLIHCRVSNTQFSMEELTAIVQEAAAAGTYVAAHAYMPTAITRALAAGVRSIEHGNWLDAETAQLMAGACARARSKSGLGSECRPHTLTLGSAWCCLLLLLLQGQRWRHVTIMQRWRQHIGGGPIYLCISHPTIFSLNLCTPAPTPTPTQCTMQRMMRSLYQRQ